MNGVKVIFLGAKCLKLLIMEVIVTIVNTCLKSWKMSKKITGMAIKVIPITVYSVIINQTSLFGVLS